MGHETYHKVRYDIVTAPLAEEGHANDHGKSVSGSTSVDQLLVVPPWVFIMGSLSLFDDLSILKFHKRRVLIAITVVFCEDGKGLLGAVLVNQP